MAVLTAIRKYVIREVLKDSPSGVLQTLPNKDLVELNVQVIAQRLMQEGIDPTKLKNANQVENAVKMINDRSNVQQGIKDTKSAKVFNIKGEELDPKQPIIGGTQEGKKIDTDFFIRNAEKQINDLPPPGSRGGKDDIAAPVQSSEETIKNMVESELMKTENPFSDLVKTTKKGPKTIKEREAEILASMEKSNKETVQRIKNRKIVKDAIDNASPGFVKGDRKYNAQLVADDLAEKRFNKDFYDLDQKQQTDIYGEALDGLDDSDKFAQGGRAGFKGGLSKIFKEFMERRKFLKTMVGNTEKNKKARELEMLKKAMEEAKKNPGFEFPSGQELRTEIEKKIEPILNKGRKLNATGGRAGFANGSGGLLDILDIKASGSKSGKQQIKGAPEGFTIDSESYNVILNADIPVSEKINLLTKYSRDKGRDRIEKDDQELFLGEGGSKKREIGLGFNKDGEGITGQIMYDVDTGEPKFDVGFKKSFADGGRIGYSKGSVFKTIFDFLNKKSPAKAYSDYLKSVKDRMKQGKEAEVAGEVIPIAASGALITNQLKKKLKAMNEEQKKKIEEEAQEELRKDMKKADGGRIGFKEGMTRRTFLKLLGGLAAVPIVGKFLKPVKVGKTVTKVPIIKTDNVPGKPEWFDALVNKVIMEGDDVTKKFATGERQSIHQKTLNDGSVVRVTEDVDDGAVRVEYDSEQNVFGDTVQMEYKKPLPDEGDPNPAAEFSTAESGPVSRQTGPDDYDIDVDEVGGSSIKDLDSDVSKLKEYATSKGPTMRELVQNIKRKDKAKRITNDPEAQSDAVIRRQGDYVPEYDDYASGGIARMLGE